MNQYSSNSDAIRPMLRAIEARIQDARTRRTGENKPQGMPLFAPPRQVEATEQTQPGTNTGITDGAAPLKARRKSTSSFTSPMPTSKIWDRQAG